jgi:phosphoribosylformylglycinamidine synthase
VKNQIFALTDCIDDGLVSSCHDIADGGLASALAEMTFGNGIGCNVKIESNLSMDKLLFSETGGFILEVSKENMYLIQNLFSDRSISVYDIGVTTPQKFLKMNELIMLPISKARDAWKNGLRDKL